MCEGASKQSPDPTNSSALGPRPGSEIPGSATDHVQFRAFSVHEITFYYLKVKKYDHGHKNVEWGPIFNRIICGLYICRKLQVHRQSKLGILIINKC